VQSSSNIVANIYIPGATRIDNWHVSLENLQMLHYVKVKKMLFERTPYNVEMPLPN